MKRLTSRYESETVCSLPPAMRLSTGARLSTRARWRPFETFSSSSSTGTCHIPAVILDRYSNCIQGNGASGRLLSRFVDRSLLPEHANHLRVLFHPLGLRRVIVNWTDVSRHMLALAERELGHDEDDQPAAELLRELREYAGGGEVERSAGEPERLLLPVHIRAEGLDLRLFSTIMSLGSPRDVTLQELRIETFFPADAESEQAWVQFVQPGCPPVSRAD